MANGKKTVLVVGPLLPTGGVTRYVRQLLGRTSDSFQYRVFDTARAEKKTAPRNGGYGIILSEGWGHALRGLLVTLSHMAGFPAHLRKSRPHLVHICGVNLWGFWENAYYMCVCRAMGVSVTVHYLDSLDLNWERCGWTERMVVRQVFRLPAGVAVLSQRARQTLLEISPAAYSVVVPSSVDPAAYALSSSRPLGSGDAVRVLFVGGVGPYRKGLHELLGAAEMLWSTGTPVLFVITGPVAEEAAKQAGEWMGENVRFTGIIPEDEMIALYHSVDILALPSYDEGLPYVVVEAMSSGLPVVASSVGGLPEVVKHGDTGLLIQAGDVRGLAAAIDDLANDSAKRRRLGGSGRRFVEDHLSTGVRLASLELFFDETLDRLGRA